MARQGQIEVFEEAKRSIASELDEEILSLDFSQMLSRLRAVIAEKSPAESGRTGKAVRFFCRHFLDMHGDSYLEARNWLSEEAVMPFEKIQLVLRVLKSSRDGTLVSTATAEGNGKQRISSDAGPPREPEQAAPKMSGMIRMLIDHATTLFNSLMLLIIEAGVNPHDLFEGDRIQIRIALKRICDAFGIDVIFPEPETARNRPLTRKDLAEIGLEPLIEKRRRRT